MTPGFAMGAHRVICPLDPYIDNVVLQLHFDGTDGNGDFWDLKGKAAVLNGTPTLSSAQAYFAGTSGLFDSTTDGISFVHATDFQFSGDLTIDVKTRFTGSPAPGQVVFDCRTTGASTTGFALYRASGNMFVYCNANVISLGSYVANSWDETRLVRSGSAFKALKNGTQVGSTWTVSTNFSDGKCFWGIGSDLTGAANGVYLEEARITKGVARDGGANYTSGVLRNQDS